MTTSAGEFHAAVRRFCEWTESKAGSSEDEARIALRHVTQLFRLALELPLPPSEEVGDAVDEVEVSRAEWQSVYARHGKAMPFSYYSMTQEPFSMDMDKGAESLGLQDLGDDLADIWRDLSVGFRLYERGLVSDAVWQWRHLFDIHWGNHAAGAIYALTEWGAQRSPE